MDGMNEVTTPTVTTGMVDALEVDLTVAQKAGEVVAYIVPFGEGYTDALAVGQALVDRLRARVSRSTSRRPGRKTAWRFCWRT